ncbi:uncharacterized protein N7498_007851 [Penicillium cinerascens]|uniref:Uncharacterized protein n=1 Tax=Penicillium cinerascens TaxID=70096 RepID=A0A9W9JKR7_9EURO|nr:uncharacterized protein N7498_007851 [Penicillium cinerascens]KAJ5198734.1 hypothetical protein N7498_007851 [Penicillium cinerascens]
MCLKQQQHFCVGLHFRDASNVLMKSQGFGGTFGIARWRHRSWKSCSLHPTALSHMHQLLRHLAKTLALPKIFCIAVCMARGVRFPHLGLIGVLGGHCQWLFTDIPCGVTNRSEDGCIEPIASIGQRFRILSQDRPGRHSGMVPRCSEAGE